MNSSAYDLWCKIKKSSDMSVFVGNNKSMIRAFNELKNAGFIPCNSYVDNKGVLHCPRPETDNEK